MPVDLNRLTEGWLELESDPGLFTLLLEDFGVQSVQVEEIYDLQKSIEGPVYGYIFLFKWIEERRSRRKFLSTEECFIQNEDIVNSMFFAHQMVPNSCATHALLSVLLNCDNINLGSTLNAFREYTNNMCPENKGFAIGNSPELARAHNSHARPEPKHLHDKSHGISSSGRKKDAFHFVSYVPINGHLFELDGLRPYPIDHGKWDAGQDWTEKFRHVITERLGIATRGEPYHDIRFNLMAVVPDKRAAHESKLKILKTNRKIVMEALQQLIRQTQPELLNQTDIHPFKPSSLSNQSMSPVMVQPKLPPALDSHNYAKSPITMFGNDSSNDCVRERHYSSDLETLTDDENAPSSSIKPIAPCSNVQSIKISPLKPVTVKTSSDIMTPLTIQTPLSPTFSTCSTDTSSEIGSAFNSPIMSHNPPENSKNDDRNEFTDISKFVCIRVTNGNRNKSPSNESDACSSFRPDDVEKSKTGDPEIVYSSVAEEICDSSNVGIEARDENSIDAEINFAKQSDNVEEKEVNSEKSKNSSIVEPHRFAPKDLLALLKTLELEICECEANLKDEVEKRRKYKVDDCRRTHNYDQFITTFLSMLSEQGKLTNLINQNCVVKGRQRLSVGRVTKNKKKPDKRRKRQRSRKKK